MLINENSFLNSYKNRKLAEFNLKRRPYKLPLRPGKELAGISGDILSDGHLGSNMIMYFSKDIEEINDFDARMKTLFGVKCDIRPVVTNPSTKMVIVFDGTLMKILSMTGIPTGKKVLTKYDVPKWILRDSNEVVSEFLRRMFGNDGCITFNGKRIKIKLHQQKAEHILNSGITFMNSIRNLLQRFEIKSTKVYTTGHTIRKDGIKTIGLELEIHGTRKTMKNVMNFQKFINFSNKTKRIKLANSIAKLKAPRPL